MDPKEVGERLRKARRDKGLVLKDLQDIFSIGKLSNIEKGKIPVDLDDIKKICERLDIPLEHIIDSSKINYAKLIMQRLPRIRSFIAIGHYTIARKLLKTTKNDIIKYQVTHLLPEIYFYYGQYQLKRGNHNFSKVFLKKVIDIESAFEHTKLYKIRACNALAHIEYQNGQMVAASKYTTLANEILHNTKNTVEEEANINFNHALISLNLGNYQAALRYSKTAFDFAEGSFRFVVRLVMATIQIFLDDTDSANTNLLSCIDYFTREEDSKNLSKVLMIRYFLCHKNFRKYKEELLIIESIVPESTIIRAKKLNVYDPEITNTIHMFAAFAIQKQRYDYAMTLLKEIYNYQEKFQKKIDHNTYYLEAQIIKETTKDENRVKELLEKSLKLIEHHESFEKAIILHELYEISGEKQGILYESNNLFYKLYKTQLSEFNVIRQILPPPRY